MMEEGWGSVEHLEKKRNFEPDWFDYTIYTYFRLQKQKNEVPKYQPKVGTKGGHPNEALEPAAV